MTARDDADARLMPQWATAEVVKQFTGLDDETAAEIAADPERMAALREAVAKLPCTECGCPSNGDHQ